MIPGDVSRGLDRIEALVPRDETLAQQDVVLVNAPFKYLCNFVSVVRRSKGGPSPRHWWCLGVSPGGVDVRREGANTLVLRPESGYLASFEDTNVRSRRIPFAANDAVDLDGLSITVRAVTADARPQESRRASPRPSRAARSAGSCSRTACIGRSGRPPRARRSTCQPSASPGAICSAAERPRP